MKWTQVEEVSGFSKTVDYFTDEIELVGTIFDRSELQELTNPEGYQDMEVGQSRKFNEVSHLYRFE